MIMSWTEPSKIRGAVQSLADLSFYFGHFGVIQQTQSWSFEVLEFAMFCFSDRPYRNRKSNNIQGGFRGHFGGLWADLQGQIGLT